MVKTLVHALGYEVNKLQPVDTSRGFELHRHRKLDGTFDYEKYRQIQTAGNKRKLDHVFAREENIAFLSDYINAKMTEVKFGICHGTRRGKEQEWFSRHLGCEVLGTEIADTAEQFPSTIQWDFHDVKPEWLGAVDFVYSNALDHSHDPEKCLSAWMSCVRKGGLCILEHTSKHERATELDPFGADIRQMPYLILTWGKGKFCVREILDAPSKTDSHRYNRYLIIEGL